MWTFSCEERDGGSLLRFTAVRDGRPASFADVVAAWQADREFSTLFSATLAAAPFPAFRWETPGVTTATAARPFEFVLLDTPGLARRPEPEAFAEHFGQGQDVVAFTNLGGDATLVVPCPVASPSAYGHLAAFVRGAPGSQCESLWRQVGQMMSRRIGAKPVWLSTAGAGVSWLHVRLDDQPKYYGHAPYRRKPG